MEVSGKRYAPAALLPWETISGFHRTGGWVSPKAGLDIVEKRKISTPRFSSPKISLYTD
jgi:hypothetical protein